jgi:glycosyltransferase involved in cell wall biosynthesis
VAKIACLTPNYFSDESYIGGGERYPLNLSRGIVESSRGRHSVEILSFGPTSRAYSLGPGLGVRVLAAARKPLNWLDVVSWELPSAIAEADLVHVHQAYTRCSEMAYLVAKQQGKPIVVTDHGGATSTLGTSVGCLELVDHIIANSEFGAALYQTSRPITVVKGGVDGVRFRPARLRSSRRHVLYVGRVLPHKGIDQLIAALPDELPLVVCGRAYDRAYFDLLQELAEGKDVTFITDADDDAVLDLYQTAWATVLPSTYRDCYDNTHLWPELMGFALLESMACGTPAICSNVGGMPEYVLDGVNGYVFDDAETLTDRLRRLAGEPELVEELGREGRRRVVEEYDLRVAAGKVLEVYEPLLNRSREVAA